MSNGAQAKIIIDSRIAGNAARYGVWGIFKLALEGALLTASGDATKKQVAALAELDEWLVAQFPGSKIVEAEAQYVASYNEIMGR